MVWEWDYRIQINAWGHFQPFMQYFIQPNGTGAVRNAMTLGFVYAVSFWQFQKFANELKVSF